MRPRISIWGCVRPSVRPSVRQSLCNPFFLSPKMSGFSMKIQHWHCWICLVCWVCLMCWMCLICLWTHRWPAGPCFFSNVDYIACENNFEKLENTDALASPRYWKNLYFEPPRILWLWLVCMNTERTSGGHWGASPDGSTRVKLLCWPPKWAKWAKMTTMFSIFLAKLIKLSSSFFYQT